jgi:cytochrome c biogenesis protein CcmG, thiol:disulfide interchange protein DsbE
MLRYRIPLVLFVTLLILLGIGLNLDPRTVPSPLVGKPAPEFNLPRLHALDQSVTPNDFKGKVWVLNVWASWCASCRVEHPVLNQWAQSDHVLLVGLNYKDQSPDALRWLQQLGNPYAVSLVDADGRVGIDWGVYGVPETFVIDKRGTIRYKHIGPVSPEDVEQTLRPLIHRLQDEPA